MDRRTLLAGSLVVLLAPLAAEGQQPEKVWRIGFLTLATAQAHHGRLTAFREGMQALGYVEGKNVIIEERYGAGHPERMAELAAELVRLKMDIVVVHGAGYARHVQQASKTIPVVFAVSADPVGIGAVDSLARPGGNVTGLSDSHSDLVAKRLALLKEIAPSALHVAVLWDPTRAIHPPQWKQLQAAAPALGVTLLSLEVSSPEEFDRAFATIRMKRPEALFVFGSSTIAIHLKRIMELALETRLPAIYTTEDIVAAGGLMSYGANHEELYRRAAGYVDRILKGAKPADLPVEQPTKFDLVINLKTAKALGLTIPPSLLLRADQIIE